MSKGNFDHWVDAAHRGKSASELEALPVDALKGVSAADRDRLEQAFGIRTVGEFASHRFIAAARSIHEEAAGIGHDPGPGTEWSAFFAAAPLATYQAHPQSFRLDFGPVYYRGRLDGSARLLIVGQDPAANELIAHRAFVGASGQRLQGFLRRLGITRDYLMVNTFLYPVFGQFIGDLRDLTEDPHILGYRNQMLDRIADSNPIEAVITVGSAARDAVERWSGSNPFHVQHLTHPSAKSHGPLLANWNAGLDALRPLVAPEAGVELDEATYGTDWRDEDHEVIPRRDLPFGLPEWHGVGSRARRARTAENKTDHKRIIWKAP